MPKGNDAVEHEGAYVGSSTHLTNLKPRKQKSLNELLKRNQATIE